MPLVQSAGNAWSKFKLWRPVLQDLLGLMMSLLRHMGPWPELSKFGHNSGS